MRRPPAPPEHRRASGLAAESIAAAFLEERGWEILARNHHCRGGEVDLVARKGRTIAFVEVRSRANDAYGHPVESVTWSKRRRIVRAAVHWARGAGVLDTHFLRFDVIGILFDADGRPRIRYIEGAFDADGRID
ncbi:MAG TPA: YraN family protein [Fredinandcohnia sp.]|nr:YraN family protein [Fredinandcohnia sp.]